MLAVTGLATIYVLWRLDRGWMPLDDGMLAQSAERLNAGELPHRDFDEVYTGGLTWLNAWALRVLGDRLWSFRVVMFAVVVAWVPTVQYIASRFVRPWHAALVTALAVAWAVPNYPAAMPSWYNLFFATFSAAALLRYVDDGRARWLFAAGMAAGISVLFKIIGIFAVAAGLLSIVFLAREDLSREGDDRAGIAYAAFVTACLALFVAGLLAVVRQAFRPAEVFNFVVPGALIAAALIHNQWRARSSSGAGFTELMRRLLPFAAGVAVPVGIFLVPFVLGGAVDDLVRGVFILPQRRFEFSAAQPLPLWTMLWALPVILVVGVLHRRASPLPIAVIVATAVGLAGTVWISGERPEVYRAVWYTVRSLPVLAVALAAWHIARGHFADDRERARLMVVAATLACCSLVQFPYSAPAYFCYAAPLLYLAMLPWIRRSSPAVTQVAGLAALFLIAFAVMRINASPLQTMGLKYERPWATSPLPFERGGIRVPDEHARVYGELIPVLQQHARGGYTWAAPDAPEIYYLSGLKNPTRSFYEFLDDSPDREGAVLRALDARGVTAVVLNKFPFFSPQVSRSMFAALSQRYPRGRDFGPFLLLWRE